MKIAVLFSPNAFGERPSIRWDDVESCGLTGTDLVCVKYAEELARRGHRVTLYYGDIEAKFGNVVVAPWHLWRKETVNGIEALIGGYDVALTVSDPFPLHQASPAVLRVVNRQVSVFVQDERAVPFDICLSPSRAARDVVMKDMSRPERFLVLHDGYDPAQVVTDVVPKTPGRCVYISSPDRGLHLVLDQWPRIKLAVPHASLHVFYYSLEHWLEKKSVQRPGESPLDSEHAFRAQYAAEALHRMKHLDVRCVGGVSHRELQIELARAEVLAYPCTTVAFTETFGCAVLEAAASRALPILSTEDAFGELWSGSCPSVPTPAHLHLQEWSDLVIRALRDPEWRESKADIAEEHAKKFSWRALGAELESVLLVGVEEKRRAPVVTAGTERPVLHMVMTRHSQGDEPIDVDHPFDRAGGGGCPTEFIGIVREMPALGWDVRCFAHFANPGPASDGVTYVPGDRLREAGTPDVLLAFYDTDPLNFYPGRVKVACHITFRPPSTTSFETADVNTAPSQYTVDALRGVFGGKNWSVLPNSILPGLPEANSVGGRVFSHTSIDRGLHHLFGAWPEIRRLVPEATLHVVGPVEEWLSDPDKASMACVRAFRAFLPKAVHAGGVELLGPVSRSELYKQLSETACFAFPFSDAPMPCETFSRSTMEALAVGVPVVLTPGDALRSVYETYALFVERVEDVAAYHCELARVISGIMDNDKDHDDRNARRRFARTRDRGMRGREYAYQHTFKHTAVRLDKILREAMQRKGKP